MYSFVMGELSDAQAGSIRQIFGGGDAGIMLYISFEELVPSSRQYGYNSVALWSLFAGVCIMPISLAI